MTKTLSIIFLFLFFVSCGGSGGGGGGSAAPAENATLDATAANTEAQEATDLTSSASVPNEALTFDINLKLFKFSREDEDKIYESSELIKQVIASDAFKNKVLNHKYKGKKTFVDNGGLSNAQIYEKILTASEKLTPGDNNTMDLELELYQENNSTVGYTYPSTIRVWMNDKFFKVRTPAVVTTNMMHEWLHKLGFKHDVKPTPSRKYSVPYAIGYMVRDMAKKLAKK